MRVRSILRVAVATIFLGISGLISLGANVTSAVAKKVTSSRSRSSILPLARHAGLRASMASSHRGRKHRHRSHFALRGKGTSKLRGVASWYGNEFHNRKTASGVIFDTHAMMAAHRSLPFGTLVRVTNILNQKSCIVEITDRGPFSRGRIIDLSYAAAEKLGMMESGIARVQLEVVGKSAPMASKEFAFTMPPPAVDRLAATSMQRLNQPRSNVSATDGSVVEQNVSER